MKHIKKYREGGPVTRYGSRARKMNRRQASEVSSGASADRAPKASEPSFKVAFAKARRELGPGKTFTYKGKKYSTNRATDLKPKAGPKAVASKGASALKTGVKKAGLQTSKASVGSGVEKSAKAKREDRRMDRKGKRARTRAIAKSVKAEKKEIRTAKQDARKSMTRGDKLRARAAKADARSAARSVKKAPGKKGGNLRTAAALKERDIKSPDRFMAMGGRVKYVRKSK